jgi:hypothetical protein
MHIRPGNNSTIARRRREEEKSKKQGVASDEEARRRRILVAEASLRIQSEKSLLDFLFKSFISYEISLTSDN